jgi:hypothetical protein
MASKQKNRILGNDNGVQYFESELKALLLS